MKEDSVFEPLRQRLALAVYGEWATEDQKAESLEDLLWRVGQRRREEESAHSWLDVQGAPRKQGDDTLTLRGRMDQLGTTW